MSKDKLKLSNKLKDKYLLLLLTNKLYNLPDNNTNNFKHPLLKVLLRMPVFKLKSKP